MALTYTLIRECLNNVEDSRQVRWRIEGGKVVRKEKLRRQLLQREAGELRHTGRRTPRCCGSPCSSWGNNRRKT